MENNENIKKLNINSTQVKAFFKTNVAFIVAFAVPVLIMILVYISKGIYPFGDFCYLRSDMYHQYAPFHMRLWNLLHGDGSALYTFEIGLGTDFASLASYYLASPLNLLLLFFTKSHVIEAMSFFIILKIGLCGFTFSAYLSHKFKTKHITIAAFSVFYALSAYVAAYSWNLMWADCLVLLPIIALGIERLVIKKKPLVYCIALGVAVFSNYYIGIMLAIFAILYFAVILFSRRGLSAKEVGIRIGKFVLYSLIAAGIAAVMILPAFFTLKLSASGDIAFPFTMERYFSVLDMLSRMLMNVEVNLFDAHTPNLYSTVAVFMFVPLYFLNKKVDVREKVLKTILVVFLFMSFSLNIPDFLWHGLHFPNCLPARQSFIFIFLLLTMVYEGFRGIKIYSTKSICVVFAIAMGFLVLVDYLFVGDGYDANIVYISALFVALYFAIIFAFRSKFKYKNLIVYLLFVITIAEAAVNTTSTAVGTTGRSAYLVDNEAISTLVKNIKENDEDKFFRFEKLDRNTKNDSSWNGYYGASIFSSAANANITKLLGSLGHEQSENAYSIYGATPLTQAMLSVKYWISKEEIADDPLLTFKESKDNTFIYENRFWLSPGFMVPSDFESKWDNSLINPFAVQNDLAYAICGSKDLFEIQSANLMGGQIDVKATKSGRYYIYITTSLDSVVTTYYNEDGTYFKSETVDSMTHPHILDLGELEAGQYVTIITNDTEVKTLNATTAILNKETLFKTMEFLSDEMLDVTEMEDTHIKGNIEVLEDGVMLTSIPYEPGWTIYVDGEKVETIGFKDAFIMVPLEAGSHEIEMKYMPQGFVPGLIISLASVAVLVGLQVGKKKLAEKKSSQNENL